MDIARARVEYGADTNFADTEGSTPLPAATDGDMADEIKRGNAGKAKKTRTANGKDRLGWCGKYADGGGG